VPQERDPWHSTLHPGGKYYLTRNGSSLIAFSIGEKWKPGNAIALLGAHTDSPCLRIKPVSKKQGDGFLQVGVEAYGGGLWHTWFDRDLSIAGRAMVRSKDGKITGKLLKVDRPILRIPTLAVHLDRQETFTFNKETQLFPIAGLIAAELNKRSKDKADAEEDSEETTKDDEPKEFKPLKNLEERHHPAVLDVIAEAAGAAVEDILDFEVVLYDTQKSVIGGINNELIFSPRLDNLMMTFCSTIGLIESVNATDSKKTDASISLISLFDHEEIGSRTAQGADSNFLPAVLRRLSVTSFSDEGSSGADSESTESFKDLSIDSSTAFEETLSKSFLISADMAHSVHPNYGSKYESDHRPEMNKGVVIKVNANARYATNSPGIVLLEEVARLAKPATTVSSYSKSSSSAGVPLQLFVVRNDSSCGSTIGPMLSAKMGMRTLDLGNPQLSMHSIRETGGVDDVEYAVRLFESYFEHFESVSDSIFIE
jgi:aspartyl aminopeptidase